jgi:hypothetical protein
MITDEKAFLDTDAKGITSGLPVFRAESGSPTGRIESSCCLNPMSLETQQLLPQMP